MLISLAQLGKMTMGVISTVAQFERDLLIERTQSGLARVKSQGKTLGRPKVLSELQTKQAIHQLGEGKTIAAIARHFTISRQTIMRITWMLPINNPFSVALCVPLCKQTL